MRTARISVPLVLATCLACAGSRTPAGEPNSTAEVAASALAATPVIDGHNDFPSKVLARGGTAGVFQFESGGMRRLLVEMKPDRLGDLSDLHQLA